VHKQRYAAVYALLLGLLAVAAWLRLRDLGADSVWYDEAASWLQSKGSLGQLIAGTARDNYPPLHNLLLYTAINIAGTDTEWVLRLPSALLGIANVIAIYWLGVLVGGRVAGVLAAAILTASSMHIYFSQEARMYSLLALAATLYAASAFHFAAAPTRSRAVLVAASGLALVYSHPFGTLNWIAITIGISINIVQTPDFQRRNLAQWIKANAVIAIGFLPWAIVLMRRIGVVAGRFWVPFPSVDYVYAQINWLCGGPLAAVVLLAAGAIALRTHTRVARVLLVWLIGPFAVALLVSLLTSTHILNGRYLIGELPALATLAALGIASLAARPQWWMKAVAATLLAVAATGNLTSVPTPRDDWRKVAGYLHTRLQGSDCVLVYPASQAKGLLYYLRRPFCSIRAPRVASLDFQGLGASRLFTVFVASTPNQDIGTLREKLKAFGREGESLTVQNLTIVEYVRQP